MVLLLLLLVTSFFFFWIFESLYNIPILFSDFLLIAIIKPKTEWLKKQKETQNLALSLGLDGSEVD